MPKFEAGREAEQLSERTGTRNSGRIVEGDDGDRIVSRGGCGVPFPASPMDAVAGFHAQPLSPDHHLPAAGQDKKKHVIGYAPRAHVPTRGASILDRGDLTDLEVVEDSSQSHVDHVIRRKISPGDVQVVGARKMFGHAMSLVAMSEKDRMMIVRGMERHGYKPHNVDMKYLSQSQYDHYQQNGFLVIDGFLDPQQVAAAKAGIARVSGEHANLDRDRGAFNLEKKGSHNLDPQAAIQRPGLLRKIQGAVFEVPELCDVFAGEPMLDCMEDLMGPELFYHSSKVMFKSPGGSAKPWHQDAAYWREYTANQITVWIALDDADVDNGCVWAIPGSHRHGIIPHVGGELQVEEQLIDLNQASPVPVKAGGLLIFHSLVLHMSHKNTSNRSRLAIICDYDSQPLPAMDGKQHRVAGMDENRVWHMRSAATTMVATR